MLHRLLPVLVAVALAGCAAPARNLDDLSASYERLVAQRQQPPPPAAVRRQGDPVAPLPGSAGSSFLAVGRAALEAAAAQGADQQIRIALYGLAARSAHFVLVEEAATGRPVEVVATMTAPGTPQAAQPGANGAAVMRRAVQEGGRLCGPDGAAGPRPARDCAYLGMAEGIARLAILAEPWVHRRGLGAGASAAERAELVAALATAPDADFNAAVEAYWRQSGAVPASAPLAPYVRTNDIRAYCIVFQRFALTVPLAEGEQIPGVDLAALGPAREGMRARVNERHGPDTATCS